MAGSGNRDGASREGFWRGHVAGWARSGESVRAYCRGQGLTESGFHFWKRELKWRDEAGGRGGRAVSQCAQPGESAKEAAFAEVRFAVTGRDEALIEIVCSGDRRVRVRPGFDGETLARVVAVLERADTPEACGC
jgi:hypothetical protein